jgi:hypothetical protein
MITITRTITQTQCNAIQGSHQSIHAASHSVLGECASPQPSSFLVFFSSSGTTGTIHHFSKNVTSMPTHISS